MDIVEIVLIVVGLTVFEIVSGVDNAIINADVLATMGAKAKRFFLTWGLFFAVFLVRGLLPWLIVWATIPSLGFFGAFTATFSDDPQVAAAITTAAPILLMGGGVFLLFLFLHWIFLEDKCIGFRCERFAARHGVWFFAIVSVVLAGIVWFALKQSAMLGFGAVIGSTAFFITHGFRKQAEEAEARLKTSPASDWSKVLFLEVIDLSFSIDGVLGAFAFTLSVPLILLGNGVGAIVVRQLTIAGVDRIRRYAYLKNGAMYSIFVLGFVMVTEGFGFHVPYWFSPLVTFALIGYFLRRSRRHIAFGTS
ncbi:MAG: uncharacterized protein QG664_921 [Patescibacteria group bacterium]|nr:uncharacterized protein [Patescibacteria group bacterium]